MIEIKIGKRLWNLSNHDVIVVSRDGSQKVKGDLLYQPIARVHRCH